MNLKNTNCTYWLIANIFTNLNASLEYWYSKIDIFFTTVNTAAMLTRISETLKNEFHIPINSFYKFKSGSLTYYKSNPNDKKILLTAYSYYILHEKKKFKSQFF